MILDVHTHLPAPSAILCVEPWQVADTLVAHPDALLAVGIHPWSLAGVDPDRLPSLLEQLRSAAASPRIVAIGETGLDTLCASPMPLQRLSFEAHIRLAAELRLPLLLHVVRTAHEILSYLRRRPSPAVPWIWHGFRGNPTLASQFLAFPSTYISFGPRFNPATPAVVPLSRLLLETDATTPSSSTLSSTTISSVASSVAAAMLPPISPSSLLSAAAANASSLFQGSCKTRLKC